jgi:protoporphyrinogen oxidase
MGLAAAYHAAKRGHHVTVLEAAPEAGGMAAHFDLGGISIERFYHFVCKPDRPTFALMEELGIADKMRWVPTTMGYFVDGRLHKWGDPIALLTFPELSLIQKLRYGAMMFLSSRRKSAGDLEHISAKEWITGWCGADVYKRFWEPLFHFKFYELADNISAAWIWTRIKRVGTSRRSLFQEELGYVDGGSQTLVDALVAAIRNLGGTIRLKSPVTRIICENGRATGVVAGEERIAADAVICTVPTPYVGRMLPDMPADDRARYDAIRNIAVVCLVFRLKKKVTPHFWINISDPRLTIPGIVEFSNLRPVSDTVVYVPYYMPPSNPKFSWPDDAFLDEAFRYLQMLNPALTKADIVATHVGRLNHAQPVCPPGFAATLPPVQTSVQGLQIADTCFYYPEDRGISESVRLGKEMAERVR